MCQNIPSCEKLSNRPRLILQRRATQANRVPKYKTWHNVGQLTDLFATSFARKAMHENIRVLWHSLFARGRSCSQRCLALPRRRGAAQLVALERDSVAFAVRATYVRSSCTAGAAVALPSSGPLMSSRSAVRTRIQEVPQRRTFAGIGGTPPKLHPLCGVSDPGARLKKLAK